MRKCARDMIMNKTTNGEGSSIKVEIVISYRKKIDIIVNDPITCFIFKLLVHINSTSIHFVEKNSAVEPLLSHASLFV